MFTRQNFVNPFQLPTVGYPFQAFTSPFTTPFTTPFTAGINPLAFGTNFGGIGPISPVAPPIAGFGSVNPFLATQFGAGMNAGINPLTVNPIVAAQLAATNPQLWSTLTSQVGGLGQIGQVGQLGQVGLPGIGGINSLWPLWQSAVGTGYPQSFTHTLTNPALNCDPVTAALLTQQVNPLTQSMLPIRSLVGTQPYEHAQAGFQGTGVGIGGTALGQVTDPYSAFIQAQAISPLANQIHPLWRAYAGTPWGAGIPNVGGQVFPYAQASTPFCF